MIDFPYPKKRFGQNFLQNKQIAAKIIESLQIENEDIVLEIGPGRGILTEILCQKNCKSKYALEIDTQLFNYLRSTYAQSIEILEQDILDFSYESLYRKHDHRIKVVGNIPYNITSPIIFHILENNYYISTAVLMVQKEVADRLTAQKDSKEYGILTIMANVESEVQKLFNVSRHNFKPQPKVDSAVIQINPGTGSETDLDMELFKTIVRSTFNNRRKMLRNTLNKIIGNESISAIKSVSVNSRPENLSIDDFKNLTMEIQRLREH